MNSKEIELSIQHVLDEKLKELESKGYQERMVMLKK